MTHKQVTDPSAVFGPYDQFGLFATATGFNTTPSQSLHWWTAGNYGTTLSHYTHLYSNDFIRQARIHVMASLTALYSSITHWGLWSNFMAAQSITRVVGFTSHAFFIIQSETVLRNRGVWNTATDTITADDWLNGKWTNTGALTVARWAINNVTQGVQSSGIYEYQSSYYGWDFDYVNMGMQHAPTQDIYDSYMLIMKTLWYDVTGNFHPESGTASGPNNRQYDFLMASHTAQGGFELPLAIHSMTRPYCSGNGLFQNGNIYNPPWITLLSFIGSNSAAVDACDTQSPSSIPPSAQSNSPQMSLLHWPWLVSGLGYIPYDIVKNVMLDMPCRLVEQLFYPTGYAARSNFITPDYSIGWADDDNGHMSSINVMARLSGQYDSGKPQYFDRGITTESNTVNLIQLMYTNTDNPIQSSVAPTGNLFKRVQGAQYQSFQLITTLAAHGTPNSFSYPTTFTNSLTSDVVIPLAVDALYADSTPLPVISDSSLALPPATLITVRHKNASVVIRLLYSEHSSTSTISTATSIETLTDTAAIQPGVGVHAYTYMYICDAYSYSQGVARISIQHKNSDGDISNRPYYNAILMAAGVTRTDAEMVALQNTVRNAAFTSTFANDANWSQQIFTGVTNYNNLAAVSNGRWTASVTLPSSVDLTVQRTDTYQPWSNDPVYKVGVGAIYPFYTTSRRIVNSVESLQFNINQPYRSTPVNPCTQYYQPHLTIPLVQCVAGTISYPTQVVYGASLSSSTPSGVNGRAGLTSATSTITPANTPAATTTIKPTVVTTTTTVTTQSTTGNTGVSLYTTPTSTTGGVTYASGLFTTPTYGTYTVQLLPSQVSTINSAIIHYTATGTDNTQINTYMTAQNGVYMFPITLHSGSSITWSFTFFTTANTAYNTDVVSIQTTSSTSTTTTTLTPTITATPTKSTVSSMIATTVFYQSNTATQGGISYSTGLGTTSTAGVYYILLIPAVSNTINTAIIHYTLTGADVGQQNVYCQSINNKFGLAVKLSANDT